MRLLPALHTFFVPRIVPGLVSRHGEDQRLLV
jgi:hypothetical protein